jgi:hypothetical protein
MGVNLVLRGEDHLTNTARQILLYEALGLTVPAFAHHGLLVDMDGKKLSKRSGALSIPECMQMGLDPWPWSSTWHLFPEPCRPRIFSLLLMRWRRPSTLLRSAGATR